MNPIEISSFFALAFGLCAFLILKVVAFFVARRQNSRADLTVRTAETERALMLARECYNTIKLSALLQHNRPLEADIRPVKRIENFRRPSKKFHHQEVIVW